MTNIKAYAAKEAGAALEPFEFEFAGELASDEVEIAVKHCGVCHSDLSVWKDDWGISQYPLVPGHEIVGTITAVGAEVKNLQVGQNVGVGWFSRSDGTCAQCIGGDHNLCPENEGVMLGRYGGFAERVRCQALWAIPLPDGVSLGSVGPLFCGGITVFNPIIQNGILPTDRVGVVGIGGLGHMALRFLKAWGCEVTAFSTSPNKEEEARKFGAHNFVATYDESALEELEGTFDMILVTVNVDLNWPLYLKTLSPKGTLHLVGAAGEVKSPVMQLIQSQLSIKGSPLGSPATIHKMLDFAARHGIEPQVEHFPLEQVNEAFAHLEAGKPRYRVVLDIS